MNYLIAIVAGWTVGVLAGRLTDTRESLASNVLIGMAGAFLSRYFFNIGVGSEHFLLQLMEDIVGAGLLIAFLMTFKVMGYGRK